MSGPPSQIGRYEIRKELGRGMMGVVYEAHDTTLGRTIALKTIQVPAAASAREREDYEKRFLGEARIAARLSHPGIVVVHDVAREGEVLYIALEHLHGRTLDEVVAEGPLPWREALRIVGRVAEALRYAHAQGVVHRDVKPANIMLVGGDPKIMDFGIAKLESGQMTAAGQFFGTPLYMSPEQARGEPVDARSDLFSLGSVAYHLLTGRPPFEAANVPGILARVTYQHPRPASALVPGIPPDVEHVVGRAMAKDPTHRYAHGGQMAEDVEDVLAGRPPRHREGWAGPVTGAGTLEAAPLGGLPELGLEGLEEPPAADKVRVGERPARRRRPRLALVAVLAAAAAGYFYLHPADRQFWRRVAEQARRMPIAEDLLARWPAAIVGAPEAAPPSVSAVEPPAPTRTVPDAFSPPVALRGPDLSATPVPPPASPPAEAVPPAPTVAPAAGDPPGTLAIDFEHHLRRGNLQVWVDGARVVNEDFDGRARRILAVELHRGVVEQLVSLSPGRHDVRVQVRWDDKVRTSSIAGEFQPGATRRLEVQVGRLRNNLSLAWR
ncbi:MAG TPA: serine/threonine-protein kinase [Vicinamibacteria bacterium]|nr:serine/threonine-protein kinase [Vicinamibacteria bacterium]